MFAIKRNDGKYLKKITLCGYTFGSIKHRNKIHAFETREIAQEYLFKLESIWDGIHNFEIAIHPNSKPLLKQKILSFDN